ncbi:UDP-N-acetylglucosamine 2-epimerase homolog [Candidatus Zixiibacteriota bacterium]|nr:UDP-N-acetylglucosamine 2-epimerase homolog [candidate division Zixibacteria bacterium]
MSKIKPLLVSFVGARPQFIKIAPLAHNLRSKFRHIIVHSGQHYDKLMSEIFFNDLSIPHFKYNLSVGSGLHGQMTAAMMTRLEKLLLKIRPDMLLVYGDTNSTLAGAITAAKLHIPIGHIEAGMRSFRLDMPEEVNRRLTDHVSKLLFCPTPQSIVNLKNEGITEGIIHCGDLMYQLLEENLPLIYENRKILSQYNLAPGEYLLLTMHRAGNVDDLSRFRQIVDIINDLKYAIIFPIHPRTLKNLRRYRLYGKMTASRKIIITPPQSYLNNLSLIYNARAVLTDSGGVQKEAVFLGTPCLTLREETEWVETLNQGNTLVGLSRTKINRALSRPSAAVGPRPYRIKGKRPSDLIISALSDFFGDD